MTGIYCYKNIVNGKRYIGQAVDLERRAKDHLTRAFSQFPSNTEYDSLIHRAFRKYGYDSFEYSILETCTVDQLNEREKYWISFYNSTKEGYNLSDGGSEKHFCKLNTEILDNIWRDLSETDLTFDQIRIKNGVSIGFVSDFNQGKIWKQANMDYPIRKRLTSKHYCQICGKELLNKTRTGKCPDCVNIAKRAVERPNRQELKDLIRHNSFVEIGKNFGVTDNAIRRWCDSYNLPRKVSDIKKYTDEEWNKV